MKDLKKLALLASAALAVVVSASAQTTYNGDLLVGFTSGTGTDLIYDLGSESSLTFGETWNLNSLLGASLNNTSVKWGVIGAATVNSVNTAFTTTATIDLAPATLNRGAYNKVAAAIGNMYQLFPAAGEGNSVTPPASGTGSDNSWNTQTVVLGGAPGTYNNSYQNPNVTGYTSDELWAVPNTVTAPTPIGSFILDNTGTLTFQASVTPEPSTYALFAVGGLLVFAFRNKLSKA